MVASFAFASAVFVDVFVGAGVADAGAVARVRAPARLHRTGKWVEAGAEAAEVFGKV